MIETAHAETVSAEAQNYQPSQQKLAQEIEERIMRVPEFQFIRQEAEKLGIKVYLFGGTASAYAHYVRQDLAREAGDKRYPEMFYDYDYTNIFRSTQDLDVVIDGAASKAEALEAALQKKFPHFIGDKGAKWEVRPLREARGEKEAILNNPDFMNQHTDSHSTGMVEVTKPKAGEIAVKDVRDWNSKAPQFLKDVQSQQLHYYFSPQHATTSRAAKGLNPPILSVIRYLTKAFQYDLEITAEDKARISKIIQDFDPQSLKDKAYLEHWVEKNGKKLFEHAVDIERAWNSLEELGLRKKLIAIQGNPDTVDSLSWMMSKEPLRSRPIGAGAGRTAAQIAKELSQDSLIIAHETNSFLAYESITRSKAGDLNVFISRRNTEGEMAALGEGFYTMIGTRGAKGTGITIRMELKPNAREGTDFIKDNSYIILKNRNAVRVIPEQVKLSLLEYFKMLADGKEFSVDDKALLDAVHRKVYRFGLSDEKDMKALFEIVQKNAASEKPSIALLQEWFSLPMSREHPEIVEMVLKNSEIDYIVISSVLSTPEWKPRIEWVEHFLKQNGKRDSELAKYVLNHPIWKDHPDWVETVIHNNAIRDEDLLNLLQEPHWSKYFAKWLGILLDKGTMSQHIIGKFNGHPIWVENPDLIKKLIDNELYLEAATILGKEHKIPLKTAEKLVDELFNSPASGSIAIDILSQPYWATHPEWVERLLKNEEKHYYVITYVLSKPHWANHPEWVEYFLKKGTHDRSIATHVLSQPHWANHPEWVKMLLTKSPSDLDDDAIIRMVNHSHYSGYPEWIWGVLQKGDSDKLIATEVLTKPFWSEHPEWIEHLIQKGTVDEELIKYVLHLPQWKGRTDWVETIIKRWPVLDTSILSPVLYHWTDHPEYLLYFIDEATKNNKQRVLRYIEDFVIKNSVWQNNPTLIKMTNGNVTLENLQKALQKKAVLSSDCAKAFQSLQVP